MSLVSLVKIPLDTDNSLKQAINESLALINFTFDNKVKKIVIKPNLCYYWDYTTGQTTQPHFVAELIDIIRLQTSSNVDIAIVESDASAMRCKYAFKMLGFEKLAQQKNVRLVNLSEDQNSNVDIDCNGCNYSFSVPKSIADADLRVNIAHIKYTNDPIKLTCALKNIFGCNPYQKKYKFHSDLENVIVALNKLMKFDLCIVDNNIASGVQPRKLGLVMASKDPVALDVVAAKIAWLNPKKIRYLSLAEREGVGSSNYVLKGDPLEFFRDLYPKASPSMKFRGQMKKSLVGLGLGKRLGLE